MREKSLAREEGKGLTHPVFSFLVCPRLEECEDHLLVTPPSRQDEGRVTILQEEGK